jgi:GntP family gluconate:H+ symporter
MTHAFLPPHPGPVAAAAVFGVDLGWVVLMGVVCGIPAVLAVWAYSAWIGRRIFVPVPQDMADAVEEARAAVHTEGAPRQEPVSVRIVLAIIGTPLVLILLATFSSVTMDEGTARSLLTFFGHPFVALTIALFLAYWLLGIRRGWSRHSLETVSTASLKPIGNILLVVGAGGVFGAVLKASGIADALARAFGDAGLPVILPAWLLSVALRVAQGSATVAIVTTAGIVQPVLASGHASQAHLALVIVAISAGSIFASHVNDGGFWMVAKYFGISERDTLRTWTVLESVLSVAGFAVAGALSLAV